MEDTRRVMKTAGLIGDEVWKRVSLAYLNRVMGDHVNEALWNLVEPAKFKALAELVDSGEITEEESRKFKYFVRTKCSKHKLANLSKRACDAMSALQKSSAAKHCNMEMKPGRTYESMGYKIVEVAAWQFSNDISVANPHGHAQEFADWEDYHDMKPKMAIPNVTKNAITGMSTTPRNHFCSKAECSDSWRKLEMVETICNIRTKSQSLVTQTPGSTWRCTRINKQVTKWKLRHS